MAIDVTEDGKFYLGTVLSGDHPGNLPILGRGEEVLCLEAGNRHLSRFLLAGREVIAVFIGVQRSNNDLPAALAQWNALRPLRSQL